MGKHAKPPKTTINEVLDEYPRMFYREPDGNHYKYNKILSDEILNLKQQKTILEQATNIKRPLKIWKEQILPNQYTVNYEVNLQDIKRVILYREGNAYVSEDPLILLDSGELPLGTDNYLNSYADQINPNLLDSTVATGGDVDNPIPVNTSTWNEVHGSHASITTEESYVGFHSLKCVTLNTDPMSGLKVGRVLGLPVGAKYTQRSRVKLPKDLSFECYFAEDNWHAISPILYVTGTGEWQVMDFPVATIGTSGSCNPVILRGYQTDAEPQTFYVDTQKFESGTVNTLWTPPGELIPTTKYFLYVEDYHENRFVKGIPENKEILGDKYDHDMALDRIGTDLGVPRRIFDNSNLTSDDYPNTYPTYCIEESEDDYRYEQRITEYMEDLPNKSLPALELKKYFGIEPIIEGRWRYVGRMNSTEQNKKYMKTANWNSSVFNVSADVTKIPKNILVPSSDTINSILLKTFPLSKVAYFSFIDTGHNSLDILNINPVLNCVLPLKPDILTLTDYVNSNATIQYYEILNLTESLNTKLTGLKDVLNLTETVGGYVLAYTNYATQSDFQNGSVNGIQVGSDGIIIDPNVHSEYEYPTNYALGIVADSAWTIAGWSTPNGIYQDQPNLSASCYSGSNTCVSKILYGTTFPFTLPDSAFIVGINCDVSADQTTTSTQTGRIYLNLLGITKSQNVSMPANAYHAQEWGGSTNLLGYSSLKGSDIKSVRVGFADLNITPGKYCYINWIGFTAWWVYSKGTWDSPVLTLPASDHWEKIEGTVTIPSQSGPNAFLVDIIDSSNGNAVLSNKTFPVDISGVTAQNIKVRVKLNTTTRGYSPKVSSLKISSKNNTKTLL